MKRIITFLLLITVVVCFASCKKEEGTVPYKLTIECSEIIENLDNEKYCVNEEKKSIIPSDGIILEVEGKCPEGENVYDLVIGELKAAKLQFEGSDGYFTAVSNIYAGDCGEFSGWMFFVNGALAELGASDTIISENDTVEFRYIVDYTSLFN